VTNDSTAGVAPLTFPWDYASELYSELRAMATRYFRDQPSDHVLQPTALVHEAFLKLARPLLPRPTHQCTHQWTDRTHFLATAARAMR